MFSKWFKRRKAKKEEKQRQLHKHVVGNAGVGRGSNRTISDNPTNNLVRDALLYGSLEEDNHKDHKNHSQEPSRSRFNDDSHHNTRSSYDDDSSRSYSYGGGGSSDYGSSSSSSSDSGGSSSFD